MRTTIRIDDHLYRRTKELAARSGRTVGELIEDAIRESLRLHDSVPQELEPLPTFAGTGVVPGVDLDDSAALAELMHNDDRDALR